MLEHGGRPREAAGATGSRWTAWLDLSTGINPRPWPVPAIPVSAWARLPEDDDGLIDAARAYYEAPHVLPVAGSQAAIQALPRLRSPCRVGIITPGYAEHARGWRRAGHEVVGVPVEVLGNAARHVDVLAVIHPNSPTGDRFAVETLLDWHDCLAAREGWLVVDEAFIDPTPADSLALYSTRPGLLVLRSLGKFFGLAGARVGFVLAESSWLHRLRGQLASSAPGRSLRRLVGSRNAPWRTAPGKRPHERSSSRRPERLAALLNQHGLAIGGSCVLFQWVPTPHAAAIHERLARQGILTRLFTEPASLRFGLPGAEAGWARLDQALANACTELAPT